jgi:male-specific lethal 1
MSLQQQQKKVAHRTTISLEDQLQRTSVVTASHNQPARPISRTKGVQDLTEPRIQSVSTLSSRIVRRTEKRLHDACNDGVDHSKKTRSSVGKVQPSKSDSVTRGKEQTSRLATVTTGPAKMKRTVDISQRSRVNADVLTTDLSYYYTACHCEHSPDTERVLDASDVLVPSWRINTVHTLYVIEGTENLNDSVFIKRHQKSEMEEKRRKRWDIQRTRDLLLLQRSNNSGSDLQSQQQTCIEPFSFLPEADKVQYVEVSERIPVSAFGFALPKTVQTQFSLPWAEKLSGSKTPKGRQHK